MNRSALDDWRAGGDFLTHRGQRIFWRAAGAKSSPVLLLIHGFPTASFDWEPMWPELTRSYRVLAPDMVGFGFSDKPRAYDYSIVDQADLHEALLRAEGVSEVHILAHDYGDSVAQELLARHVDGKSGYQLKSVCFLNGGLFPESHRPLLVQKILASRLGPIVARLSSKRMFARSMRSIFGARTPPGEAWLDDAWQLASRDGGMAIMPQLIGYIAERRRLRERWVGALQRSPIPLKVIDGVADPISGGHMVDRYETLVPKANVTRLAGIGHYPQVEAPADVLSAYRAFRAGS